MSHKISLKSAIFINLNIMAGAGIFINTVMLTKLLGTLGGFTYVIVGVLMLPLITSVAQLVTLHPSGGLYAYARPLSPFWGFISCWSYFFSKLASASLIIYVSAVFLQQLLPTIISDLGALPLSLLILAIFTYLNLFNLTIGSAIQTFFFIAKAIPIFFVISVGFYFFNGLVITLHIGNLDNIITAIPLTLYSLGGFEAACSLSRKIENPQVNAPKAIFYSFFTIIAIYTIFQLFVSSLILPHINQIASYQDTFLHLTQLLPIPHWLQQSLLSTINLLIGCSALGGAYGILLANPWNLYTLAEHNHTFIPTKLTELNTHGIPTFTIIAESVICLMFLLITNGSQIPLQQTTSFGAAIAYTISTIALLKQSKKSKIIPTVALIPCFVFITLCIISLWKNNITSLGIFIFMLLAGIYMFIKTSQKNT